MRQNEGGFLRFSDGLAAPLEVLPQVICVNATPDAVSLLLFVTELTHSVSDS
jgi:hypothetical protein